MENSNREKPISAVIDNFKKRYRLQSKFTELDIANCWEKIVGTLIYKHTSEIKIINKTLYVKFDNAPLKNEMFLQKEMLLNNVNEFFQKTIVEKIFIS